MTCLYHFFPCPIPNTIFTRARMTANIAATQNPLIPNPGTNFATSSTMRTLMTRERSPRVRILRGRVRTFRNGDIVLFTIASTTATTMAVRYPSIVTQGVRYAAIATAIAEMRMFMRIFIQKKWRIGILLYGYIQFSKEKSKTIDKLSL